MRCNLNGGCVRCGCLSERTHAADAEVLKAWPRHVTGHKLKGLRKQGQTPGILFSLPDNSSQLVALDSKEITHTVRAADAGCVQLRSNALSAAHRPPPGHALRLSRGL